MSKTTLMADLRAKRAKLEAARYTDIEIPGWDGLLVARYAALQWETIRATAKSDTPTPSEEIATAWDTLIAACVEVLTRGDDGSLHSLTDTPLRYEEKLAKLTGNDIATTPREVIDCMFPTEVSLMTHFGEYMEWLSCESAGIESHLGKF